MGGVAQHLLSEESHNDSNQQKMIEERKRERENRVITGTNDVSGCQCFQVHVILSQFAVALIAVISDQTDKINGQFLALNCF